MDGQSIKEEEKKRLSLRRPMGLRAGMRIEALESLCCNLVVLYPLIGYDSSDILRSVPAGCPGHSEFQV